MQRRSKQQRARHAATTLGGVALSSPNVSQGPPPDIAFLFRDPQREMTVGSRLAREHLKGLHARMAPFFNNKKKKKRAKTRSAWIGRQEGRATPNPDIAAEEKALFPFEAAKQRDLLDPSRPLLERPFTADGANEERVIFRELRVPYEHLFLDGRPYSTPTLYRGPKGTLTSEAGKEARVPLRPASGRKSWLEQYRHPTPKPARVPLHAKCKTQAHIENYVPPPICISVEVVRGRVPSLSSCCPCTGRQKTSGCPMGFVSRFLPRIRSRIR